VPISPRREPNQQVQEVPPPKATQTLPSSPYLSSLALPISPLSLWLCLSLLSLSLSLAQPMSPLSLWLYQSLLTLSPLSFLSRRAGLSLAQSWRRAEEGSRRGAGSRCRGTQRQALESSADAFSSLPPAHLLFFSTCHPHARALPARISHAQTGKQTPFTVRRRQGGPR
jgi:hypothetical protein